MTDNPRHDRLRDLVTAVMQATYPRGIPAQQYHNESYQAWWNRVYTLAGNDAFLPDCEDLRFRELMRIWEHCLDKQLERLILWRDKIEEWYPEQKEEVSV